MIVFWNEAGKPEFWEQASWIATVIACAVAVLAALFAGGQLVDVRRASQATLLLELDARFDSEELRDAREVFAKFREDINKAISTLNPSSNDVHKEHLVREEWKKILAEMRTQDQDNYIKLIGYIGFFETVGLMVQRRYISKKDVFSLFKGPLIDLGRSFRLHIEERSNEMGVPAGMFEHALSLSRSASCKKKS
jgi:hypothetical protein